jgi:hypothetical protein
MSRNFWTPAERVILRQNWGKGNIKELAAMIGRSPQAIREEAVRLGLPNWRLIAQGGRKSVVRVGFNFGQHGYATRPEREKKVWREVVALLMAGKDAAKAHGRLSQLIDVTLDGVRRGFLDAEQVQVR